MGGCKEPRCWWWVSYIHEIKVKHRYQEFMEMISKNFTEFMEFKSTNSRYAITSIDRWKKAKKYVN